MEQPLPLTSGPPAGGSRGVPAVAPSSTSSYSSTKRNDFEVPIRGGGLPVSNNNNNYIHASSSALPPSSPYYLTTTQQQQQQQQQNTKHHNQQQPPTFEPSPLSSPTSSAYASAEDLCSANAAGTGVGGARRSSHPLAPPPPPVVTGKAVTTILSSPGGTTTTRTTTSTAVAASAATTAKKSSTAAAAPGFSMAAAAAAVARGPPTPVATPPAVPPKDGSSSVSVVVEKEEREVPLDRYPTATDDSAVSTPQPTTAAIGGRQFPLGGGGGGSPAQPQSGAQNRAAVAGKEEEEATKQAVTPPKLFTMREVGRHNTAADMWCVIDSEVYDVTGFQDEHPGGAKILLGVAGKDATKKFDKYHRRGLLERYKATLVVGYLDFGEAMTNSRKGFLAKLGIGSSRNGGSMAGRSAREIEELRKMNTI